jgi:hypothetical protein
VSRALLLLENCAHKNGHSPPEPALVKMIIVSINLNGAKDAFFLTCASVAVATLQVHELP